MPNEIIPRLRLSGLFSKVEMMSKASAISSSKDVLGGTPVFEGTRVPVKTLFDYLESGDTTESFLNQFPSVTKEQVLKVLEESKKRLLSSVA